MTRETLPAGWAAWREHCITPTFAKFVSGLPAGRHTTVDLWDAWRISPDADEDFFEDRMIFRYALSRAGLRKIDRRTFQKD